MEPHDVVAEFLVQGHDRLDRLELALIGLERDPNAAALLREAVAVVAGMTRSSAALGFRRLCALLEAADALLRRSERGDLPPGPAVVDALLTAADAARAMLDRIESDGRDEGSETGEALAALDALAAQADPPPDGAIGEVLVDAGAATEAAVSLARHAQELGDARPLGEILLSQGSLTSPQLAAGLDAQSERRALLDRSVRVDADLLDGLLDLAENLAERRDEVLAWAATLPDGPLRVACERLDAAVEQMRAGVRRTRLRRFADACDRLPRLVRDLAAAAGKVVRLQNVSGDLELPRPVLHAIREPLALLVRNAVDHGVESPAARRFASKGVTGTIRLRAYLDDDGVAVEVADDGGGIDPALVRGAALHVGVLGAYELARLSDEEVVRLVFLPGLALPPTGSRGGFGLALVQATVEALGGEVELWSERGIGTTVRFRVPLLPAPVVGVATVAPSAS